MLVGADPKTAFDANGLLDDLKKALAERALNAEMDHHLAGDDAGNSRKGYGRKTVTTDTGRIELEIPRDRQATFDPQLIAKYQRRFPGFDYKIVPMYARGMSAREIVGHLPEIYGPSCRPTSSAPSPTRCWRRSPPGRRGHSSPSIRWCSSTRRGVKVRVEGIVRNKAVHIALGVRTDGTKEILGLWLEQSEGARFWLRVIARTAQSRRRGPAARCRRWSEGLPGRDPGGLPGCHGSNLPRSPFVSHPDFVSYKDRKPVAALKGIYRPVDAAAGEAALGAFEDGHWGHRYPAIIQSWRRAWSEVVPFYAFLADVRRMLYTECDRGPERQAPTRCAGQATLPHRRGRDEAALPGLGPLREGMENGPARVVHGQSPVRRHFRRALRQGNGRLTFNTPPSHGDPYSPRPGRERARSASSGRRRPLPAE